MRADATSSRWTATCRTIRATSARWSTCSRRTPADIVAGWRKDRKDPFLNRRLPSTMANWLISTRDRREAARLRLLAEGVPRRSRQVDEVLRRNAPISPGDRQRVRRHHRRARRQPSRACTRQFEVRDLPHHPRGAGSDDGQVPHQLLDAAGADFRAAGAGHGRAWHGSCSAWLAYVKYFHHEGIGDRPLLFCRHPAGLCRHSVADARPAGRDAGADVSRITGQADLHHQGISVGVPEPSRARGERTGSRDAQVLPCSSHWRRSLPWLLSAVSGSLSRCRPDR